MLRNEPPNMLLLLSCFSHVRLCATSETVAHQAPPSLGSSRQQYWSGLPFPSPMHASENEVAQLCPTPSDPMDCSPPGSSVCGICQAEYWSGLPLPSPPEHASDLLFWGHWPTLLSHAIICQFSSLSTHLIAALVLGTNDWSIHVCNYPSSR